jgi:site-specific recombinase XerD
MTLSEAARKFTKTLVQDGASRRTEETYQRDFDQLVAYLMGAGRPNDIREFTVDNLRGFLGHLRDHGIGPNTIRGALSAFSSFAKWAMTEAHPRRPGAHLLEGNPVQHIKRPKAVPPPEKYLTLDELHAVLAAAMDAPPHERIAFALVIDQPLRASEWVGASVRDLTLAEGDRVAIEVKVKGGHRKKKALGEKAAAMLTAMLRQREARPDEPLLVNSLGRRWSRQAFSQMVHRIGQRAGLQRRIGAHAIRHAIASMAAHKGATVYEIAEMLNHRSLQTAQRYIHGVKGDAALDKVREALWA